MTVNETISEILARTELVHKEHYERTFKNRLDNKSHGSTFIYHKTQSLNEPSPDLTTPRHHLTSDLAAYLRTLDWCEYEHPAIDDGCIAFAAVMYGDDWTGHCAVVNLDYLPFGEKVEIGINEKSQTMHCLYPVNQQTFRRYATRSHIVVLIAGKTGGLEGNSEHVLFTFHPGKPVSPSHMSKEEFFEQFGSEVPLPVTIDRSKAAILGFDIALLIQR